ncbi:tRNA (guanosine(46)-N7)-methyltransferase TrmB [Paenibacillus thermoaerophilus]|uniref:tRNA (guanine-N(7)-)-methyltransferase n=1 Tax=Paenibacillus thermoaerophilus TaxID=1215385 RepID=A0ABW2V628_9BACL|nr:tRNA (guanosine(46)-N7)-methyltransferase TrmB [Paenibacillus thermoaerophilus]TMV15957.1 tRNA (guanosine(46)-N7)-methyltransferase TrmB [Paenibacillus thermoaerophilus]
MRLRGRTGIREDLLAQPQLVTLQPGEWKGRWRERFGNDAPIHVELGMGKGKFISEMSRLHPDINFIGIDMFDELLRRGSEKARKAHEGDPPNLVLALWNIERIEEVFASGEIERIYLNFSDPWPKKRHAKRRLTHPRFVRKYIQLLNEHGEIHMKTDSRLLFEFSLNSFADMGLRMRNISLDLHADGPAPNNVMTEYETKFHEQGMNIYRCEVVVGSKALERHLEDLRAREAAGARKNVTP